MAEGGAGEGKLATRILIGLVAGAVAGLVCNLAFAPAVGEPPSAAHERVVWIADWVANPLGQVFLRLLFMVVVPLVFSSLVLGVAALGDVGRLGRVGGRTFAWFLGTTALAVCVGLVFVNVLRPGDAISPDEAAALRAQFEGEAAGKLAQAQEGTGFTIHTFVNIIPRNVVAAAASERETLGVIVFALLCGIAAGALPRERTRVFLEALGALYDVCVKILGYAMRLAPYGVAGLVFAVTSKLGLPVLQSLAAYVGVALGGLLFHLFVVLAIVVRVTTGIGPLQFFKRSRALIVTAFSTSSSNATLPTSIRTATDEFGVPPAIAGFVLPLGATMNMNGTALFEGVSVLFLAQVAGVELSLAAQAIVLLFAVLTAIGAAGVPGGSLPLLSLVLIQAGVPPEMLALILGVDRLVDMTRTVPNVMSDLACSIWVAKKEGAVPGA